MAKSKSSRGNSRPEKTTAAKPTQRKPRPAKPKKELIPTRIQDYIFIAGIFVLLLIFFGPAIFGAGFGASDNVASISFKNYLEQAKDQGVFAQWLPYIFGGMPSYGSLLTTGERSWDFVQGIYVGFTVLIGGIFNSDAARMMAIYFIMGLGAYLLMRSKKMTPYISFFTAAATVFSTGVIVWVMIGHNTKPVVFAMLPYVFLLLEKLRIKFSVLYAVLLVFAIHIMFEAGHLQMIFYSICAVGFYVLIELISRLIKKEEVIGLGRGVGILVLAGVLAFLMSADRYFSVFEYAPHSTRDSKPIRELIDRNEKIRAGEPLEVAKATGFKDENYDYATNWSFSVDEIATFFVPNYFGYGKMKYKGDLTGGERSVMHFYWGRKPFEDAPPYAGIIVLALALIGFVRYRGDPFVQSLLALSIFALFLSFGKHLPIVYDLFYRFVPSFDKFRAPSMALALVHFALPIMAGFGLNALSEYRERQSKEGKSIINFVLFGSIAFLVVGFLFSAAFKGAYEQAVLNSDMINGLIQQYGENSQRIVSLFKDAIWSAMISDWYVTAFILLASALTIFFFYMKKIPAVVMFAILGILLIVDLWRVDFRRMDVPEHSLQENLFSKTDLMQVVEQDDSIYRVADFASASPNIAAYFLMENVNGYHAAKLRVYQDLMDVANEIEKGSTSNLRSGFLWDLMNVKYIMTDKNLSYNYSFMQKDLESGKYQIIYQSQASGGYVVRNEDVLPRAFFVESVEYPQDEISKVNGKEVRETKQIKIINRLKNQDFDPRKVAFLEKKTGVKIDPPTEDAFVKIVGRGLQSMELRVNATGNNLLFLGEIFYEPSWKAYVGGDETEIYKTNYAFRSIVVPKGEHTIKFEWSSAGFQTGKTISVVLNVALGLAFLFGLYLTFKDKLFKKKTDTEK